MLYMTWYGTLICASSLAAPRVKRQNLFGWQLGSPSIFGAGDSWNLDRSNGELSRKSNLGVAGQNLGLTSALRLPGFGNGASGVECAMQHCANYAQSE